MTATLTSKGQVTIPKAIRDRLGLSKGTQLEFDETAPCLTARKVHHLEKRALQSVVGCLKIKMKDSTKKYLDEVRGKADLP